MKRKASGQSMIEFVMATLMLTPFVLVFADAATLLYAKQLNEKTCMEAARLASTGTPKLLMSRATEIVSEAQGKALAGISLQLVAAETTVKQSAVDALNPYGGEVSGTVSITTETSVTPTFIRCFLGKDPGLIFRATQQVPCTYSLPSAQDNALSQNSNSAANGGQAL
jgi:hypothetical protein